jgi:hypothetical protein
MPAVREESAAGTAERDDSGARRGAPDTTIPGALLLAALTLVWAWWGWRDGASFGVVFYPGAIVLCLVTLLLFWIAPWRGSLRVSAGAPVALAGLIALGAWTLLSMLWSPAPDEALSDGGRVLLYALSFGLGVWLCHLLGRRMLLALLPLAVAAGLVGLGTAVEFITADSPGQYIGGFGGDGTLKFPIGYRNANAAFFLIAFWPALGLAASTRLFWPLRGAMLGCAAICLEVALLSQSRGSLLAMLGGAFAWLLFSPWRVRALAWLALALVPAAVALPWLLDVYSTFNADEPVLSALADAGWAIVLTAAGAMALGAAAARLEPRPTGAPALSRPLLPALAAGLAATVVVALGVLVVAGKDPMDFINQRITELRRTSSPNLSGEATRFGFNIQSPRSDLWRVAWDDAREDPLLGEGSGGFEYSYLRERNVGVIARDAHSVEMELLSELGFPALVMFGVIVIGATTGAVRSRRLGTTPAALAAAALASGAYWLVHSSIEWFWTYPALTAPVFGLLGSAAAPAALRAAGRRASRTRWAVALVVIAGAAVAVPLYLSDRYTSDAYRESSSDLERAYSDLDRAEDLNPFADAPLLAEGAIARQEGDRERAIDAFREATERKPDEWASRYLLGLLLAREDPAAARQELARAVELNPRSGRVRQALARVETQLEKGESRRPGGT